MRFKKFIREDEGKKKEGPPSRVDKVKDQQDYENARAKRAQLIQLQRAQQDDLKDKQKDDLKKQAEKEQEKRLLKKEDLSEAATEIESFVASAKARAFKATGGVLSDALLAMADTIEKDADVLRRQVSRLTSAWGADDEDMDKWHEATAAEQLARRFDASASEFKKLAQQIDSGRYDWQTHQALAHALELMVALKKTIA